ncbi:hypothetical protein ACFX1T_024302 [Malus domestica]
MELSLEKNQKPFIGLKEFLTRINHQHHRVKKVTPNVEMNSIQLQEDHLSCKGSFEHARIVLSNFSSSVQLENVITLQDKSSAPSREEGYSQRRDEQRSAPRGSSFLQMELRESQDSRSANSGRNSMNVPPSPHFQVNGRSGSSEYFWEDTKFGSFTGNPSIRSPQYFPDFDAGDSDPCGFKRKGNLWRGESDTFEQRRYGEMGSEL